MFILRKSTSADLQRNYVTWRTAVDTTHHFLSASDREAIADLVANVYLPQAELTVAVDVDDVPLGFMGATGSHIDALFVHADNRGLGVGRHLVDNFRAEKVYVTVDVNEQNLSGVGFYRRLGFQVVDRTDFDDQGRPYPLLKMRWDRANDRLE
jgi:putative acetyltransferase